jgi:hypothetical protein
MTVTRWVPNQHGAWAMLALPIVVGVAASRPSPWHFVLTVAAFSCYLASASVQAARRARRRDVSVLPAVVYGVVFAITGLALVADFPLLLAAAVVLIPAAAVAVGGARPGTRRDLANSFAQVLQALVLVPAAGLVSGAFDAGRIAVATVVAAGYLVGTVLVVRSVLRERGNAGATRLSGGWHLGLVGLAVVALAAGRLPAAYFLLAACLAVRALLLPRVERRRAGTARPLRPVQVGIVEIMASLGVAAVTLAWPV